MIGNAFRSFIHATVPGNGRDEANLVLHYAFDVWMARQFPHLPFERYADDAIVHCRTRREAEEVRNAVAQRLQ